MGIAGAGACRVGAAGWAAAGCCARCATAGGCEGLPSPSQTAAAGPGHPFSTPDERKGRWEILDSVWTDEGLQLQIRIYSDSGTISFSFMAFSNASTASSAWPSWIRLRPRLAQPSAQPGCLSSAVR